MGNELTGILSGTGAKMKGEVMEDFVAFRGAVKADVPFEDIVAEARGTLLILMFQGHTVELGAGARASQLAAKVRSPPSRMDRLGIEFGLTAATAGPLDAPFKSELGTRTDVVAGIPRQPVDVLFFAIDSANQLEPLAHLAKLVKTSGALWIVHPSQNVSESQLANAAKIVGLVLSRKVRFSATQTATKLTKRPG